MYASVHRKKQKAARITSWSLYSFGTHVTADSIGLTWTDLRGKHHATWEDVMDFYSVIPEESKGSTENILRYEVVSHSGEILRFAPHWFNYEELRDRIAERAVNANIAILPDGSRGWEVNGARPMDLPVTFTYDQARLRAQSRKATLQMLCRTALFLWPTVFIVASWHYLYLGFPPSFSIGLLLGFVVTLFFYGVTLFSGAQEIWQWWRGLRARRETRERMRRGERFEASGNGLTFYQDGEARFAPWQSITGYDFVVKSQPGGDGLFERIVNTTTNAKAPVCRIRTVDGKEFPLTNRLSQFPLLQRLLRRYAPDAIESQIAANSKEALGGVSSRWTGGEEGKGSRVFHLHTRSNNVMVFGMGIWGAVIFGMGFVRSSQEFQSWGTPIMYLVGSLAFAGALYLGVTIFKSRLELSDEGLTLINVTQRQRVPWGTVHRVDTEGHLLVLILDDDTKISLYHTQYAYGSEIRGQIEERIRPFQKRAAQGDVPTVHEDQAGIPTPSAERFAISDDSQEQRGETLYGRLGGTGATDTGR
jgi:hypothetical protein